MYIICTINLHVALENEYKMLIITKVKHKGMSIVILFLLIIYYIYIYHVYIDNHLFYL